MSDETADPYSYYLGLAPGPRPLHYYDLMELELFCSQHERIDNAARKQFRLIKPYQDHPERATREMIQDLMNEIAAARVVLTDPDQKEAYDKELAERLGMDRDTYLANQVAVPLPEFALLVVAGPSLVERCVDLVEGAEVTVGSDIHCSLSLSAGRAGSKHCCVAFENREWLVRPCSPEHEILVNDTKCVEFALAEGDHIDVGGYRLRFVRVPRGERSPRPSHLPPPLSMMILRGPSIRGAVLNALPPQRMVIGHSESVLWQLPDRSVSRHHCAIQTTGDRWELEDLESETGTQVNGAEVLRHLLSDRDVVSIGPFEILVGLRR